MSTTPRLLGQNQLSPASSSPLSGHLYQQWLLSASGTGKFTPVLSVYKHPGHLDSRSPKHLGAVPRPHCLAKCHCAPRKHIFTLAPTPSRSRAESLRSQPAEHQPWKCFSKSLPAKLLALAHSGTWGRWLNRWDNYVLPFTHFFFSLTDQNR